LPKIPRYPLHRVELELGIEHVVRLGYVVHYVVVFIVVGYIDIDFIRREPNSVRVVE